MNTQEILRALQVGGISFEDAEKKLTEITVPEEQQFLAKSSNRFLDDTLTLNMINENKIQTEEHPELFTNIDLDTLKQAFEKYLTALIGEFTKIPVNKIDSEVTFEEFGLESIMISNLNQKIEQLIGTSDVTLFFKYNSIGALCAYLVEAYPNVLSVSLNKTMITKPIQNKQDFSPKKDIPAIVLKRSTKKNTHRKMVSPVTNIYEYPDIAIIGVAGRYPQAATLEQFWRNLYEGKDCIEEIPLNRWSLDGFYEPDRTKAVEKGLSYSKWGGFLEDIECFDPLFFNISPRDAMFMDPHERLFLEAAWNCLEDAGYTSESLKQDGYGNKIGVFVGATFNNYQLFMAEAARRANQDMYAANSQIFSIANRVSYLMNFTGPSLTVDTACSSSLYAIQLACESIRSGQSRMAIAGGVNLSLHPSKYITISQGQFNASDGRCHAFCEGGTGYVPSEAVGAIFLKPLKDAIKDNDHIYGIVKGIGASHAGKSNGYTVPNPVSQSLAIEEALQRSQIHPRTISCIEAHGTGTALGDPIEITGLTDVFRKYTKETGFCSISSVKSNIGHAEAAAGIAQLTKVLLQFKHETLVKNVMHGEGLNPHIQFAQTPFVVQENREYWKRPIINGLEVPRRAGISSFGAGGANAHVVIEEYIPKDRERLHISITPQNPAIIVLSAKNEERLQELIQRLLVAIQEEQITNANLADGAYTLQVGRKAMEERLALIVGSVKELEEKLKGFLEGQGGIEDLYRGQVKHNKAMLAVFALDEDMAKTIDAWIAKGKYAKLLDLWVKGLTLDWNKLYSDTKPCRISLPTYPFARERYWVPKIEPQSAGNAAAASTLAAFIHPLLHQNTSDLSEQRFSSTFTGREFFLADHVVKGQLVLPEVAYLEMARAAVEQAAGGLKEGQTGIRLKNVVWAQPITGGDQMARVHIGLFVEDNGEIAYEIYSEQEAGSAEPVVHSQGSAVLSPVSEIPTLDLSAIQAQCNRSNLSSSQLYEVFRAMGIDYGPGYQGVEKVYVGMEKVLAKLSLPSSVFDTVDQFSMHPSLMDSALQASIGLRMGSDDTMPFGSKAPLMPALPFALQELEILSSCTPTMWAFIRYSDGSAAEDKVQKLAIDLCDDQGNVFVRMKGFSSRVMEGEIQTSNVSNAVSFETANETLAGTSMFSYIWDVVPVEKSQINPSSNDQVVIIGGTQENRGTIQKCYPKAHMLDIQSKDAIGEIANRLEDYGLIDHVVWIAPHHSLKSLADDTVIEEQNQGVIQVFRLIKALLRVGYGSKNLGWSVLTTQAQPIHKKDFVNPIHASVYGLIGSMSKEYPNWKARIIDLEADCDWPLTDIFGLPADPQGNGWVYRGQEWYRQKLIPVHNNQLDQTMYKTGGVYVVIGGAGGIGEVWSDYMIRTYQAQIIWIGRRAKDSIIQAKLDKLATIGPAPHYIAADATNQKALQQAYEEIKEQYAQIHGVIHSAIVLLDQSLAKMDEERFQAGLSAKVDVSVRIAQVFEKEALDFVMFFSSMNSFTKPAGQSNYVSGCTFKDAFAHQLSQEWQCAVKAMNWGYWGNVGIVSSKAYQERMAQAGIGSIEPSEGMEALELLLTGPMDQIALMKTTKPMVIEGKYLEELIMVNTGNLPSTIQNMRNQLSKQDIQIKQRASEESLEMKEMENLLCRLLIVQLQSIGLFNEKNEVISDLKTKIGLRDLYDRWLEESITVLARKNYLEYDGSSCSVIKTTLIDRDVVWKEWDQQKGLWLEDPNVKAQVILVEVMLRALPEILTGKRIATDIMFPNSSMELVEGIYKNNLVADFFNEVLAETVIAFLKETLRQDPRAEIRIIEIGAGTGGTSAMVFRKLKPYQEHIKEYCYTDISKAFLMHAEKEYGPENPYLTYQLFDVEAPIAGQNISAGGYDLLVATNVLHATKNIRQTLRNSKAVLKNNGLIILNEICGNSLYNHLTFGLLEGWWLYEDSVLRIPGCPGISPDTWQVVLEHEGFRSIFYPTQENHELGQQIVVAESDGVIRQKPQLKLSVPAVKQNFNTQALKEQPSKLKPQVTQTSGITQDLLREKSTAYFKKIVGETLKLPSNKIDSSEPLEKYGIDSILVVQLTNTMSKVLDNISSTLLFEYQTIDALVEHFLKTQKDSLIKLIGSENLELDEAIYSDDEIPVETSAVRPKQAFRKSRRFLQYCDQEIEEPEAQSFRMQDVAIIGLSGRYPGAKNVNEFWNNLKAGRNCITEIPKNRWDWKEYFDEEKGKIGSIYTKWGGFIEDIDKFDPLFFSISPAEAEKMDPQERLFLEVAYASIEDAGYKPSNLCESRKIGVFVGSMNGNYPTGSSNWSIANRISYLLNFQGPSMAVDTACSSSLTAIHLALESIYSGMSECAIAGGVNLIVDPVHYLKLSAITMLSSSDKCKSFGDQADGFVDGEGVGAIVLKPMSKAIADGDHIYGIIKGSMLNAGGKTNGYTVPNPNAQSQLITGALERASVHARTMSYLEAHGTGTSLGDPIEIAGLTRAFEQDTQDKQFCAIGSAKSNIGHCESAAGIAGVTKVLLQLKHRQLVPSLHSEITNPNIEFTSTPFIVQQELAEWKRPVMEINGETKEYPRIAGISGFGAGGANAHIVIEEYIPKDQKRPSNTITPYSPAIIVLSAKNEERLREQVHRLLDAIGERSFDKASLADIAYTLQVGREAMEERLALSVGSIKELEEKLKSFVEGQDGIDDLHRGQVKRNKETLAVFVADEELQEAMEKWIQRRKYSKLLQLWVKGLNLDWNKLYGDTKPRRISLPTYPFARERYWLPEIETCYNLAPKDGQKTIEKQDLSVHRVDHARGTSEPLKGKRVSSPLQEAQFEYIISQANLAELKDNHNILHVGYYQEILCDAVNTNFNSRSFLINNMDFLMALSFTEGIKIVNLVFGPPDEKGFMKFQFYSRDIESDKWSLNVNGSLKVNRDIEHNRLQINQFRDFTEQSEEQYMATEFYHKMKAQGFGDLGESVRRVDQVWYKDGEIVARFRPCIEAEKEYNYSIGIHPGVLDACAQLFVLAGPDYLQPGTILMVKEMKEFYFNNVDNRDKSKWCHLILDKNSENKDYIQGTYILFDEDGLIIAKGETKVQKLKLAVNLINMMQDGDENSRLNEEIKSKTGASKIEALQKYLQQTMAEQLGMLPAALDIDEPLWNYGMDSIISLNFRKIVETTLGIKIPVEEILQGPSIKQLAATLIGLIPAEIQESVVEPEIVESMLLADLNEPSIWYSHRIINKNAKFRLFCFPYGGGGASLYRDWQANLPDYIEVCPIQMPGKENRIKERAIENITDAVNVLAKAIEPELDIPYGFYGHSFGALLGYRLAYKLWRDAKNKPSHLFLAAYPAPQFELNPYFKKILTYFNYIGFNSIPSPSAIENFTSDQLKNVLHLMGLNSKNIEEDVVKILLSKSLADLKIVGSFKYNQEDPFDIPITTFHGSLDNRVTAEEMESWNIHTSALFKSYNLPGNHFFLSPEQDQDKLLVIIKEDIKNYINEI